MSRKRPKSHQGGDYFTLKRREVHTHGRKGLGVYYLVTGPVPLVLDLRLTHECWGNTSNPLFNENLHYPQPDDIDRPLNETDPDKIRGYRTDDHNSPSNWKTLKGIRGVSETHLEYELVSKDKLKNNGQ